MASHHEDLEDGLAPAQELPKDDAHGRSAYGPSDNVADAAEGVNLWVLHAELAKDQARVSRENGHDDDEGNTGPDTHARDDRGEREDTEGDRLCEEDSSGFPV